MCNAILEGVLHLYWHWQHRYRLHFCNGLIQHGGLHHHWRLYIAIIAVLRSVEECCMVGLQQRWWGILHIRLQVVTHFLLPVLQPPEIGNMWI